MSLDFMGGKNNRTVQQGSILEEKEALVPKKKNRKVLDKLSFLKRYKISSCSKEYDETLEEK